MDQGPLVTQVIDAGTRFLEELTKSLPVQFAFWLKAEDESRRFYIAPEQITDENVEVAYDEIIRAAEVLDDPWFDVLRVSVIGTDDPLAKRVAEIYQRYRGRAPIHLFNEAFPGTMIMAEELYIYPSPIGRRDTGRTPRKKTRPRHPSK